MFEKDYKDLTFTHLLFTTICSAMNSLVNETNNRFFF